MVGMMINGDVPVQLMRAILKLAKTPPKDPKTFLRIGRSALTTSARVIKR